MLFCFPVNYIPVGTAQAIHYSGKMTISVLLFWIFKNEKLSLSRGFSVVFCIAGCILMIQPPPLFSEDLSTMRVQSRSMDIDPDFLSPSLHRHGNHHKFPINEIIDNNCPMCQFEIFDGDTNGLDKVRIELKSFDRRVDLHSSHEQRHNHRHHKSQDHKIKDTNHANSTGNNTLELIVNDIVNEIKDETNDKNPIDITKNKTLQRIIIEIVNDVKDTPNGKMSTHSKTIDVFIDVENVTNQNVALHNDTNATSDVALTYGNAMIGITLTLLSSLFSSLQYFLQRTTILKQVPTAPLTWWTYVVGVLPSAMCMLIRDKLHIPTDTYSIVLINGHVLTAFATKTLGIFSGSRASGENIKPVYF